MVHLLLDADLSNPPVEATARKVLATLRKSGHQFFPGDIEDPECLVCLFEALMSAAGLLLEGSEISQEMPLH